MKFESWHFYLFPLSIFPMPHIPEGSQLVITSLPLFFNLEPCNYRNSTRRELIITPTHRASLKLYTRVRSERVSLSWCSPSHLHTFSRLKSGAHHESSSRIRRSCRSAWSWTYASARGSLSIRIRGTHIWESRQATARLKQEKQEWWELNWKACFIEMTDLFHAEIFLKS